jgi:cell division protein FtsI (penicillin-binding protein 3)
MMEGVVLFGTGRKAILDGYTSAGKTGTAQKVDPVTGGYHPWKHVASFIGFAPVQEPAISVVVVIDSAKGLHQGGQIAAPVFRRVAQQVLAYLNVPHDVELPSERQQLLLRMAKVKDEELIESTPSSEPAALAVPAQPVTEVAANVQSSKPGAKLMPASAKIAAPPPLPTPDPATALMPKASATAVIEVGSGIEVPSMLGQPLRRVIELAQEGGFEVDIVGSGGVAREQSPAPGARVAPGSRVAVRFAR